MNVVQNQPLQIVLFAQNAGLPVDNMEGADFEVRIWKPGLLAWQQYYLVDADIMLLGEGYYVITLHPGATDTIGALAIEISGELFEDQLFKYWVELPPISNLANVGTCIVFGNIVDIGGNPGRGQEIRITPIAAPSAANQSILTTDPVLTMPDAYGNFSLALIREETVMIEIARTGIRLQFVVPDAPTAQLLALLPPLP